MATRKSHRPVDGSKSPPARPVSPRGAPRAQVRPGMVASPLIKPPAQPMPQAAKQRTRTTTLPATPRGETEEEVELKAGDVETLPPSEPPQPPRMPAPPPVPTSQGAKPQTLLPPALPKAEGGERVKLLGLLRYALMSWAAENKHSPSFQSVLADVAAEFPELADLLESYRTDPSERAR